MRQSDGSFLRFEINLIERSGDRGFHIRTCLVLASFV